MENRTTIRARIEYLEYRRARIDAELAQLRILDRPPRAFSFRERLAIPLLVGPVRHRSGGEAN
jgi:hypothetical protein